MMRRHTTLRWGLTLSHETWKNVEKNNFSNSFVGQSSIDDIRHFSVPHADDRWWAVCAAPLKLRIQKLRGSWWYCSSSCVWIKYIIICRRMERMVAIKKRERNCVSSSLCTLFFWSVGQHSTHRHTTTLGLSNLSDQMKRMRRPYYLWRVCMKR